MSARMKDLVKQLQKEGHTVTFRPNGHLKIKLRSGGIVYTSATPSDHRAVKNIERDLKKEGWDG